MPAPSKLLPTLGRPNATEDIKIRDCLQELQQILGGGVDAACLAPAPAPVTVSLLRVAWTVQVPLQLFKDPTGVVYVQGRAINQGAVTASLTLPIAQFPAGYRPGQRIFFGLFKDTFGSYDRVNCRLETDGSLYVYADSGLPDGPGWDFSSIPTFRAES